MILVNVYFTGDKRIRKRKGDKQEQDTEARKYKKVKNNNELENFIYICLYLYIYLYLYLLYWMCCTNDQKVILCWMCRHTKILLQPFWKINVPMENWRIVATSVKTEKILALEPVQKLHIFFVFIYFYFHKILFYQ